MAPNSNKSAEPAAQPFVKKVGNFTFAATRGVVIPEIIPAATARDTLPFPEMFENAQHNDYFFVPSSFWTAPKEEGGRGLKTPNVSTPKWQRDKIKGAMNDWRKKDLKAREGHKVVCIDRKKGQLIDPNNPKAGEYPEDGVGFWVQINPVSPGE